jgi:hypothetical protein
MGNGEWGMGKGERGKGKGERGKGKGKELLPITNYQFAGKGERGKGKGKELLPITNYQFAMPNSQCPIRNAQRLIFAISGLIFSSRSSS